MRIKKTRLTTKHIYCISDENAPTYYSESFKMIATNIEFIAITQKCKNILITSAIDNEGKTNCAVNIAIALAGCDKKVCLVDCDLRRPSVHLVQRHRYGITHVLKGECKLEEALFKHSDSDLNILLAGIIPPNPTELIASKKMENLVNQLSEKFDYIIYDSPPCLTLSDASILGRYMDVCILTVKHHFTDKRVLARAKRILESAGIKIVGSIITQYNVKKDRSNSYYSNVGKYYDESDY